MLWGLLAYSDYLFVRQFRDSQPLHILIHYVNFLTSLHLLRCLAHRHSPPDLTNAIVAPHTIASNPTNTSQRNQVAITPTSQTPPRPQPPRRHESTQLRRPGNRTRLGPLLCSVLLAPYQLSSFLPAVLSHSRDHPLPPAHLPRARAAILALAIRPPTPTRASRTHLLASPTASASASLAPQWPHPPRPAPSPPRH